MLRNKAHKLLRVAKQQYCSSIITNSELNEIYLFTYLLQILEFVHLILRKKHMKPIHIQKPVDDEGHAKHLYNYVFTYKYIW